MREGGPDFGSGPDDDDDDGPEDDGGFDACDFVDVEAQKRLWVRTILPVLQSRSHESDPSGRVQLAFDLVQIAACERLVRLLSSDLPDCRG